MRARPIVAALALLGGTFQVAQTGGEIWAGWGERGDAGWTLAVALAMLAGTLLLVAGAALLRRGPGAARLSRGAALACLALVVGLQLTYPFMSIFSRLLLIGIPIGLLLIGRRRDPSLPTAA